MSKTNGPTRPETAEESHRRLAPLRKASVRFVQQQKKLGFNRRDIIAIMAVQIGILIRNQWPDEDGRQRVLTAVGHTVTKTIFLETPKKEKPDD